MKLLRILLCLPALVCVAFLRLFQGRVKIGVLMADRIGHLAGNTEVYLCERDAGIRQKSFDIWCCGEPCNAFMLTMLRRVITVDRTGFALIVLKVNRLFSGWQRYEVETPNLDRDVHNLFEKQDGHIAFTEHEQIRGRAARYAMGIPDGAKFVCLVVRDGAYLPGLGYHAFRDSDIQSYLQAANELAARGYYVLRMGAKVDKPFDTCTVSKQGYEIAVSRNTRVIDYATNGMRSDFMDVWLGANCEFCISTGTGFDAIPYVFRRPIVYVNYVPLEYLFTFAAGSLAIWKHHEKAGKRMKVAEVVASGAGHFMSSQEYEQAGITLVDNTPQEIADVVREMEESCRPFPFKEVALPDYQAMFWRAFPRSASTYTTQPLHGEIRMRIGSRFLDGYSR